MDQRSGADLRGDMKTESGGGLAGVLSSLRSHYAGCFALAITELREHDVLWLIDFGKKGAIYKKQKQGL